MTTRPDARRLAAAGNGGPSAAKDSVRRARRELQADVEAFLYDEAALLDEWRLDEWADLFTPDGRYIVPSTDFRQGDGTDSLVLLDDNLARIRGRVNRLKSRRAHREFPWSRTRRLITNVRVLSVAAEGEEEEVEATANFAVYRIRGDVNVYVGRYLYRLVRREDSFAIRLRRAELDLESLRPHGTVSILL